MWVNFNLPEGYTAEHVRALLNLRGDKLFGRLSSEPRVYNDSTYEHRINAIVHVNRNRTISRALFELGIKSPVMCTSEFVPDDAGPDYQVLPSTTREINTRLDMLDMFWREAGDSVTAVTASEGV